MGMGKRTAESVEETSLAERKAAKKAKKDLALDARVAEQPEEDAEAVALAEKKAAKKAKKAAAAAAAVAAAEEPEEDADAVALAEKKAARKAEKAATAAAAAAAPDAADEAMEEDPDAAALAAKKAAKKATKAAAAAAVEEAPEEEEPAPAPEQKEAPAKVEAEKAAPAADDEEWKDNTYKCIDCSEDWVDTADDQTFRYDKGFAETPKRCKDCRWAKKVRMEGGDPTAKGKGKGKGKGGGGGDENTVFVRGLPFAATEESLNKDFADCGEIVTLRMPLNEEGSCKGFCFIKYSSKEGMDKALAFNETDYGGRTIYCSDAAIKPEGKGKDGKGKGKDGKGKDGKGKGKSKGKKGKASSESFAKSTGAMVESTGTKVSFADSDDE